MPEITHTPGPLFAKRSEVDAFQIKDADGKTVIELLAANKKHYPNLEANARLFATAAELAEALRFCEGVIQTSCIESVSKDVALETARDVLNRLNK